jgi:hypothetical protein
MSGASCFVLVIQGHLELSTSEDVEAGSPDKILRSFDLYFQSVPYSHFTIDTGLTSSKP